MVAEQAHIFKQLRSGVGELLRLMAQLDPTGGEQRHPEWPLQLRGDETETGELANCLNRLQALTRLQVLEGLFPRGATWVIVGKGGTASEWVSYVRRWPDALVGTVNDARLPRADWHCDVHPGRDGTLRDMLEAGVPCLVHPSSGLPNAVPYPVDAVVAALGTRYLNHVVPMLIAFAMLFEPRRICLPGCDYAQVSREEEALFQRYLCCAQWWCGFVSGRGVELEVPHGSMLKPLQRCYMIDT